MRLKIPKQPECNIGTAGHVDHGKCVSLDEYVLVNGSLIRGHELRKIAEERGRLILMDGDGGILYEVPGIYVQSIGQSLQIQPSKAEVYLQRYRGPMLRITTRRGKSVTVTPEHPLLVNNEGNLSWIKAKNLRKGDRIAVASKLGLSKEIFKLPNDLTRLHEKYVLVDHDDYVNLKRKTRNFKNFSDLDVKDLNKCRILAGLSMLGLALKSGVNYDHLLRIFKGGRKAGKEVRAKINALLREREFLRLSEDELLLWGKKQKTGRYFKIKDVTVFNEDLAKWFAFIYAEGTSSDRRIAVSQRNQRDLLNEFLEITKSKFGLEFKKASEVGYYLNCKPFIDYLKVKFNFKPGNKRESPINESFVSLPLKCQSAFLRWFSTLSGSFNPKSGRIEVSQANERNINVLAYMLLNFGINPSISVRKVRGKKYFRLMISGRRNLRKFAYLIGFEDRETTLKILSYINEKPLESEMSNSTVEVNSSLINRLCRLIGIKRENLRGNVSRDKLREFIHEVESRVKLLKQYEEKLTELGDVKSLINLLGLPQSHIASSLKVSKKLVKSILSGRKVSNELVKGEIRNYVAQYLDSVVQEAEDSLIKLKFLASEYLEFEPMENIEEIDYDGLVIDLLVPGRENFVGGFGGIILHNTTLIQALTGIWTSSHSEELRRGITIKIGYADMPIYEYLDREGRKRYSVTPQVPDAEFKRAVSFVDCPGHESLMANMLSGAAVMDGAILVIAADEPCPRPQTKEHLAALEILGIDKIVVVQNKVDLVSREEAIRNYEQIKDFLQTSTVAKNAPIIPVSSIFKLNMEYLLEAIQKYIPTPKRDLSKPARMFIIRSFDINKPGTSFENLAGGVIGGSIIQGSIKVGDELEILPGYLEKKGGKIIHEPLYTNVLSLSTQYLKLNEAHGGGLVGVQTDLDPSLTKSDRMVGNVAGKPGTLPSVRYDVEMETKLFEYVVGTDETVKVSKISVREPLRINVGSATTLGVVDSVRGDKIHVSLLKPVAAEAGWKTALARKVNERWRLIGVGKII